MADIRKLRKLQDGSISDKSVIVQNTKLYLTAIGGHIEGVAAAEGNKVSAGGYALRHPFYSDTEDSVTQCMLFVVIVLGAMY